MGRCRDPTFLHPCPWNAQSREKLNCNVLLQKHSSFFSVTACYSQGTLHFYFKLCLASAGATFEVDQSVFEIPKSYHIQDDGRNIHVQDEDNEIMQFAIQQSLLESGPNKVSAGICAVAAWARAVQQELKETTVGSVFLRP